MKCVEWHISCIRKCVALLELQWLFKMCRFSGRISSWCVIRAFGGEFFALFFWPNIFFGTEKFSVQERRFFKVRNVFLPKSRFCKELFFQLRNIFSTEKRFKKIRSFKWRLVFILNEDPSFFLLKKRFFLLWNVFLMNKRFWLKYVLF